MGFVANFIGFPTVQKIWKSVNIWQSYREFKGGKFFWDTVYIKCMEWRHAREQLHFNYQLPKPHSAIASSRLISSPADQECSNKSKSSFCTYKYYHKICFKHVFQCIKATWKILWHPDENANDTTTSKKLRGASFHQIFYISSSPSSISVSVVPFL